MKKTLLPVLLSLLLLFSFSSSAFAATTGNSLEKPEEGWTRYEYNAPEITYYGGKWFYNTSAGLGSWNSPWQVSGTGIKFNFTGTKIRLISNSWWSGSNDIDVIIDGVVTDKFSLYGADSATKKIMYEKTGLSEGEHSIEFVNNKPEYLFLYNLDVEGSLKPYNPITQPEPQPTGNRAILVVTMTSGLEKEFDLSIEEVNAFINWYDAKDAGSGPSKYAIDKHNNNKGPFSKRTDYVIFNNILTFEVNEYTATSATYK